MLHSNFGKIALNLSDFYTDRTGLTIGYYPLTPRV